MTDNKLKSIAERIGRLMDEKDGIGADIRDIYAEAKSSGYVPKVLRKAITRKRMDKDKRDEEDAILELYEGALDAKTRRAVTMAAEGATARQIEAETGIDQATVARAVSLKKGRETKSVSSKKEHETAGAGGGGDLGVPAVAAPRPPDGREDARQEGGGTGSATVVATGNLDALSPIADAPTTGRPSCSTNPLPMKRELGAEGNPEPVNTISTPGSAHEGEDDAGQGFGPAREDREPNRLVAGGQTAPIPDPLSWRPPSAGEGGKGSAAARSAGEGNREHQVVPCGNRQEDEAGRSAPLGAVAESSSAQRVATSTAAYDPDTDDLEFPACLRRERA